MSKHKNKHNSRAIPIQIGDKKPRLFLVPKEQAMGIISILKEYELSEKSSVPWRIALAPVIEAAGGEPALALKGARLKENLSQSDLSKKLGIPQSNLSEMESGKRTIGKAMAQRFSKILGVHYKVFL